MFRVLGKIISIIKFLRFKEVELMIFNFQYVLIIYCVLKKLQSLYIFKKLGFVLNRIRYLVYVKSLLNDVYMQIDLWWYVEVGIKRRYMKQRDIKYDFKCLRIIW